MLPRPAEEGCGCFADVLASAPRTGELIDAHRPAECRYLVFVGSEESDLCGFQEDLEHHVLFFLHKLLQPIRRSWISSHNAIVRVKTFALDSSTLKRHYVVIL